MTTSGFLKALYLCLAINVGALLKTMLTIHAEPRENLSLSFQRDALIVSGMSHYGFMSIRIFKNWDEMSSYLDSRTLKIPDLSYAQNGTDSSPRLLRAEGNQAYYRIFWKNSARHAHSMLPWIQSTATPHAENDLVLHAPDSASALKIIEYLKYSQLNLSNFGFAIPIVAASPSI